MRHDNPRLQLGSGNSGFPLKGVTLLGQIIASAQGEVVFDLTENVPGSTPPLKFSRYLVEIEDWVPVADSVTPFMQLGVDGGIRAGAADYQFSTSVFPSNTNMSTSSSDSSPDIKMTRIVASVQAGNEANESLSYLVTIVPGDDADTLPFVWFEGAGLNDSGRLMGIKGFGAYRGATSIAFGRADKVRFAFENTTIARGIFRLYGTE